MSKQTINLINNIVINAEKNGVAKIKLQNTSFDGKTVISDDKELISFGSYSYLGLEVDNRLKEGAIQAISSFGIQYPSSRIYSSLPLYDTLLNQFKKIFGTEVVLTTSLSLGHAGVIPVLIEKEDILILDQHVHSSVQDAAEKLKTKRVKVTVLRHNDLISLEEKIIEYSKNYRRIWYAIDGIYSMFGDSAPIIELELLMNKYPKFHLYADDAHGVSSYGKHGAGWILSKISLHDKLFLTTGMAKAFGTMGGVFITKNKEFFTKINNCTGSLIFSGPHPIPILGASIISAEIHLSSEITSKQQELMNKILFCHKLLRKNGVPDISEKETPIFFIAIGRLNAGYKLVKKMKEDGFLTNIASFPAVSESCTGLRFTISTHHSFDDITQLVQALKKNYLLTLSEENLEFNAVKRAFKKVYTFPTNLKFDFKNKSYLTLKTHSSIDDLSENAKSKLLSNSNLFSVDFLKIIELNGQKGKLKEDQWKIIYSVVKDNNGEILLTTLFTIMYAKEDMLSPSDISKTVEAIREHDKYYLSSKMLIMGTPVTEGNHLYLNEEHPLKIDALKMLLAETEKIGEQENINATIYRDFDTKYFFVQNILIQEGYLSINLPDSHEIDFKGISLENHKTNLPKKKRKYIRDKIESSQNKYNVKINDTPSNEEVLKFYSLYLNVITKALEINTFPLSLACIKDLLKRKEWFLLELNMNAEVVSCMLVFQGKDVVTPLFVGLNYDYLNENIYPIILWETIKYANKNNKNNVYLGYTASQNKRNLGAIALQKKCFYKSKDNYNQLLINSHVGESIFVS